MPRFGKMIGRGLWALVPKRSWLRGLRIVSVRLYTLGIMAVVLWAGYTAFTYLYASVFKVHTAPKQLVDWQAKLPAESLRAAEVPNVTGIAPRAPLGHYHKIDRWYQPDNYESCTTSGCHLPLPHGTPRPGRGPNRVAAFLNMHVTYMRCETCHEAGDGKADAKVDAKWVDVKTNAPIDSPAILRLMKYLDANMELAKTDPKAMHAQVTSLLRAALKAGGDDLVLDDLLARLETSAPGGPGWSHALMALVAELPRHMRGEYGAKLARTNPKISPKLVKDTAADYHKSDLAAKAGAWSVIHKDVNRAPTGCLACHNDPSTIDFAALGYGDARAKTLRELPLAKKMQEIRQGGEFELPRVPGPGSNP